MSRSKDRKLHGAFAIMKDRPFDMLVSVRFYTGAAIRIRNLNIYYSERGMVSGFEYDMADGQFAGDNELLESAAVKQLLTEIKSRTLSKEDFHVWFYSVQERDAILRIAEQKFTTDVLWSRYVDSLNDVVKLTEESD